MKKTIQELFQSIDASLIDKSMCAFLIDIDNSCI